MPPPSQAAQVALVRRFQPALAIVSTRTAVAVGTLWSRLPAYDEADIATLNKRSASITAGARVASFRLAAGFYAALVAAPPPKIDVDDIDTDFDIRAGFLATWHALAVGRPYAQAVAAGRSATQASAERYVVSTARRTGDVVMKATGQRVVGWRRVLDSKACKWCRRVSTQRYKTAESADFGHNRCGCTAVPIIGRSDPGRIINRPLLAASKKP